MRKLLVAFGFSLFLLLACIESAFAFRAVTTCPGTTPLWTNNQITVDALVDLNGNLCVNAPDFPVGATPVTGSGTGTTGAVTATLAGVASKTTYVCGFSVTLTNPTAATNTSVTLTGVITGTMTFGAPTLAAAATVAQPEKVVQNFYPCIPASAANTSIVVNSPALGAGAPLNTAAVWGYQK